MNIRRIRSTRRTVRSAGLVALAAAAAFSLTACGGGDDNASGADKKEPVAASSSTGGGTGGSGGDTGGKSDDTATESKAGADESGTGGAQTSPGDGAETPDRTQDLPDGSTAELFKVGDQDYRANIVNDGSTLATIETKGSKPAGLNANEMFILLTSDGKVTAWTGGAHRGAGEVDLEGGWKAKVKDMGSNHFRADIIGNDGSVMATMDADGEDIGIDANGVAIVLSPNGVISSHE